jgi:hypothetical protein
LEQELEVPGRTRRSNRYFIALEYHFLVWKPGGGLGVTRNSGHRDDSHELFREGEFT